MEVRRKECQPKPIAKETKEKLKASKQAAKVSFRGGGEPLAVRMMFADARVLRSCSFGAGDGG